MHPDYPSKLLSGEPHRFDLRPLYETVRQLYLACQFRDAEHCKHHKRESFRRTLLPQTPDRQTVDTLDSLYTDVFVDDQLYDPDCLEIDWAKPPPEILQRYSYQPELEQQHRNFASHARRLASATEVMEDFLKEFLRSHAPATIFDNRKPESSATVPLISLIGNARAFMDEIIGRFAFPKYDTENATFPRLSKVLLENIYRASGKTEEQIARSNNPEVLVRASDYDGTLEETADAFFAGTPFMQLFKLELPFSVPERIRFEHSHVLGGSGHGKSTLLCHQFLADVQREDSPALIIIDGKGTFVSELQRFSLFAPGSAISDRIIIVNPQDTLHPPALNMFAPTDRLDRYPEEERRQIENNTISLFEYIFGAKDFKLTAKQATCLSYCVRLLFAMKPTPTIHTLLDLMCDPVIPKTGGIPNTSPFKPFIEQQSPIVRRFFTDLFYHLTEYGETKRQIQNRIFDLLENPAFAAMFSTTERKIDLFDVIQNRKILLVNASPGVLGEKAAPLLGRYIAALTLSAAYERIAVPRDEWAPSYLILDEAQMFVDEEKTQPILQQAREFNLGVVLSHQKLDDLTPTLKATFAANTSIRYAGGVSAQDASLMAKNMRCAPDFILDQRKSGKTTSFATYVRGYTDQAVSLSMPLGVISDTPKMSSAEYAALIDRNRRAIGASPVLEEPVTKIAKTEPSLVVVEEAPSKAISQPAKKPDSGPERGSDW